MAIGGRKVCLNTNSPNQKLKRVVLSACMEGDFLLSWDIGGDTAAPLKYVASNTGA